MELPRILLIGKIGQVGWELRRTLAPMARVRCVDYPEVDLTSGDSIRHWVRESQPSIVINAAAYTAVDKAESEPDKAMKINGVAPGILAEEARNAGALLVHYSTDYVFDGAKPGPYEETDATGPLNVYGQTKLAGEQTIAASGCAHIILRTTWVYDIRGKNFLRTALRLAREREELRMVGDQHGAPTWARTIAESTAMIAARCIEQRNAAGWGFEGTYHLTAGGQTTWAGFAEQILEDYDSLASWPADTGEFGSPLVAKRVIAITSEQYKVPARRPLNSVLSNAKLLSTFGLRLPDWRVQLRLALQDAIR